MIQRCKTVELGDVCEIQSGSGFPHKYQGEIKGDYPFYKVSDMNLPGNETEISVANNYISESTRCELRASIFPQGSIIFPKVGGAIATNKKRMTTKNCCVDNNIMGLIPNPQLISQDYLRILMSDIDIYELSNKANPPSIRQETVKCLKISLPDIPEQKRIVAILDEAFAGLDQAIANTEKTLASACELFESTLNTIFTQKGEGWKEKALSKLMDITHGYAFKGPNFMASSDEEKPIVLTPGNYAEDATLYFTAKNTKRFTGKIPKDYLFEVGNLTVVMTDLSSKMKILGKPAFISRSNILHNQRIGRVIFKTEEIIPRFVYYFLRTRVVSEKIKETSTGTMVRHTAPKRILSINIPVPPSHIEQNKIIETLDRISEETQNLEGICLQKLAFLNELKQSLLQKAFSGELTAGTNKLSEAAE